MQFKNIVSVLALAMTAAALPAAESIDPRTNPVQDCSNNDQRPVCCGKTLLGVLECSVSILGSVCKGTSYCCTTNAAPVSPDHFADHMRAS